MSNTSMSNPSYNVISVLYHLLQGSDTIEKYTQDVNSSEDQELQQFFKEVQDTNNQLAQKAQKLLKNRLQ